MAAEIVDGEVVVHEWLKLAILLLFRLARMETVELGPFEYADKIPLKRGYEAAGVRRARRQRPLGRPLEPGVIMMPSYVNIGARSGAGRWSTRGRRLGAAPRSVATCTCPAVSASVGCSNRRMPRR